MPRLKIYKASAGSGKTFSLVREYLTIALQEPDQYKHILGVTFTNKATAEMKKRIVDELVLLSKEKGSPHLAFLVERLNKPAEFIAKRAKLILNLILHDYSSFQVSTIDSFFQRLIKSFARDIGLSAGYSLEMDTGYVLEQSVEKLIEELNDKSQASYWLNEFVLQRIREGKSWSFRKQLNELGQEIFKEKFQLLEPGLAILLQDEKQITSIYQSLYQLRSSFETAVKARAEEALRLIRDHGLEFTDFKNGIRSFANTFNRFLKDDFQEPNATFQKACGNPEEWYAKSADTLKKDAITAVYHSGLNRIMQELLQHYEKNYRDYLTAGKCLDLYYQFVLIADIQKYIRDYREEHDTMLISDTASFITQVMGNHEESFVFEKVGNYFHHFLIDEFQDTSLLQWNNFKPLLSNSISQDYVTVLLGDVKQSIYRFRNGDWRLLLHKASDELTYNEEIYLSENYRSAPEIVRFNNTLFEILPNLFSEAYRSGFKATDIEDTIGMNAAYFLRAYQNQAQQVAEKQSGRKGYVEIGFVAATDELTWKEVVMEKVKNAIDQALTRNYHPSDIVLLVRDLRDAGILYHYLTTAVHRGDTVSAYDIMTESSLRVGSSPAVKLLLSALYCLADKSDTLHRAQLKSEYYMYICHSDIAMHEVFISGKKGVKEDDPVSVFFNSVPLLQQMSLYELASELIRIFELNRVQDQIVFIQGFQDAMLDYLREHEASLAAFLGWWELNAGRRTIATPENKNALRIMTAHKSKGLQFPVVMVPFCDWRVDHNPLHTNILWTNASQPPFNRMPVIPVKYSSDLESTWFAEEYAHEKMSAYLDNLNLLYVALTRPETELYVFAEDKKHAGSTIGDFVHNAITSGLESESVLYTQLKDNWNEDSLSFVYGEKQTNAGYDEPEDKFSFTSEINRPYTSQVLLKRQYYALYKNDRINKGNLIHEFFFRLENENHSVELLDKLVAEGKLSLVEKIEINELIDELMQSDKIRSWFSTSAKIFKERRMRGIDGQTYIPDRVVITEAETAVIDFKTGEKENGHLLQVRNYMDVLSAMGYQHVKGYLLYTSDMEIIELN